MPAFWLFKGEILKRDGRLLHSARDPIGESQKWLKKCNEMFLDLGSEKQIVIVGFGAGFHVQALYNQIKSFGLSTQIHVLDIADGQKSETSELNFDGECLGPKVILHKIKVIESSLSTDEVQSIVDSLPEDARILSFIPAWSGAEGKFELLLKRLKNGLLEKYLNRNFGTQEFDSKEIHEFDTIFNIKSFALLKKQGPLVGALNRTMMGLVK